MAVQFDLGSKHLENKKLANIAITEAKADNTKETTKNLMAKSYGQIPSEKAPYNDYLGLTVALEEIAKTAPEAASLLVDQVLIQEILAKYSNASSADIIKPGEVYSLLCVEPAGSPANLSTKAMKKGDKWHIEGVKLVRKENLLADKYFTFALDEEKQVRFFAISEENIKINQLTKNIAGSNVNINQIQLNIDLDESACIGLINDCPERNFCIARTLTAAVALGIGHSAVVTGINVAKETKNCDNQALSSTQSVQFTIADMYGELEAGRMLTYYSADLIDNKKPNIKYATMAKVQSTDAASHISMQALQLLGNLGFLANNDFADIIRLAVDGQTKGDTNRIQKNQIYQYMLAKK